MPLALASKVQALALGLSVEALISWPGLRHGLELLVGHRKGIRRVKCCCINLHRFPRRPSVEHVLTEWVRGV